jgi:hypothetical protein
MIDTRSGAVVVANHAHAAVKVLFNIQDQHSSTIVVGSQNFTWLGLLMHNSYHAPQTVAEMLRERSMRPDHIAARSTSYDTASAVWNNY